MLHTIAHYGFLMSCFFVAVCGVFLLILLAAYLDTPAGKRKELIWEVPATTTFLGVFWAAVAFGLHLL